MFRRGSQKRCQKVYIPPPRVQGTEQQVRSDEGGPLAGGQSTKPPERVRMSILHFTIQHSRCVNRMQGWKEQNVKLDFNGATHGPDHILCGSVMRHVASLITFGGPRALRRPNNLIICAVYLQGISSTSFGIAASSIPVAWQVLNTAGGTGQRERCRQFVTFVYAHWLAQTDIHEWVDTQVSIASKWQP